MSGGPTTFIDIYTYEGNGVITPEEFYAGVFYRNFEFDNPPRVIQVDVSQSVRDALRSGWRYLGFRLSTLGPDRFWVGSIVGLVGSYVWDFPTGPAIVVVLGLMLGITWTAHRALHGRAAGEVRESG